MQQCSRALQSQARAQRPETALPLGFGSKGTVWALALGRRTEDDAEKKSLRNQGRKLQASWRALAPSCSVCVNLITNRTQLTSHFWRQSETSALAALAFGKFTVLAESLVVVSYFLLWLSLHMLVSSGPRPPLLPEVSCTTPGPQRVLTRAARPSAVC